MVINICKKIVRKLEIFFIYVVSKLTINIQYLRTFYFRIECFVKGKYLLLCKSRYSVEWALKRVWKLFCRESSVFIKTTGKVLRKCGSVQMGDELFKSVLIVNRLILSVSEYDESSNNLNVQKYAQVVFYV